MQKAREESRGNQLILTKNRGVTGSTLNKSVLKVKESQKKMDSVMTV